MAHSIKIDFETLTVEFYGEDKSQGAYMRYRPSEFVTAGSGEDREYNVAALGAVADGATDNSATIQNIIDGMPSTGGKLVFPRGDSYYKIASTLTIAQSNVTVELQAGSHVKKTGSVSTAEAAFDFQGVLGNSQSVTADISAGDLFVVMAAPDGDDFSADDYVWVRDGKLPDTGTQVHGEMNRVLSSSPGGVNFYYSFIDSYSTTDGSPVGIVLEQVSTPIVNCHVTGRGKIENSDSPSNGGLGVRVEYGWNFSVRDVEFSNVYQDAIRLRKSKGLSVEGVYIHDAPRFDSKGYGITTNAVSNCLIRGNNIHRCRHGIDVSFWSRMVLVDGNMLMGHPYTSLQLHPNTHDVEVCNNIIDGGVGYSATSPTEVGVGIGYTEGPGITIRSSSYNIDVHDNLVTNISIGGITGNIGNDWHDISIRNNRLVNCRYLGGTTGAISITESSVIPGVDLGGVSITGNKINKSGSAGIFIGVNEALVEGNEITSPALMGIWVYPSSILGSPSDIYDIIVRNNVVRDVQGTHGIQVGRPWLSPADPSPPSRVYRPVIEGNVVYRCPNSGIFVQTEGVYDLTARGNTITHVNYADSTLQAAIMSFEQNETGNDRGEYVFDNNYIFGPVRYGIVCGIKDAKIVNNKLVDIYQGWSPGTSPDVGGVGIGVYLRSNSGDYSENITGVVVDGNIFSGCTNSGFRSEPTAGSVDVDGTRISNNFFYGNKDAIRLENTTRNTFMFGNVIEGSTQADFDDNSDSPGTNKFVTHYGTNGLLGIGTHSPVALDGRIVDLVGDSRFTGTHTQTGSHIGVGLFYNSGSFINVGEGYFQVDSTNALAVKNAAGINRFWVDTVSPSAELLGDFYLKSVAGSSPRLTLNQDSNLISGTGAYTWYDASGNAAAEIGYDTGGGLLHCYRGFVINEDNSSAGNATFQVRASGTSDLIRTDPASTGKVGIGKDPANGVLDIHGDVYVENAAGSPVFRVGTVSPGLYLNHAEMATTDTTASPPVHIDLPSPVSSVTQAVWVKVYVNGTLTYLPGWQ